ncbi:MAG: iron-containing alcohol dehydrogenase [bacterium]|nr:iron-containing alcohol dehydrogenase [bacterium]
MFEFYSAGRLIFGSGSFSLTGHIAQELGDTALIVLGGTAMRNLGVVDRLQQLLDQNSVRYTFYEGIHQEPTVGLVDAGVNLAIANRCNMVIAVGGGSVLDTGKAIAGVVTNGGSVFDYLEGVGNGKKFVRPALPYIAIPTTAGTGSEVTKNAVISSDESSVNKFKVSIRSPKLIPTVALIDPELTVSLPPEPTAYSGLDALTQLIEPYVSKSANPITDALAIYGIKLIGESLLAAYHNGADLIAREKMAIAAVLSGLALANAGLGAVHALARPLGAYYHIPHGLACAILLPYIMELNLDANVTKYAEIGRALTGKMHYVHDAVAAVHGLQFVRTLCDELNIPRNFKSYAINPADIPFIIQGAQGASLRDNPRPLTNDDVTNLFQKLI